MQALPAHLRRILDLARWAPSGDNTQPWRFEIVADEHVVVHGLDTRDHVVYDLDGHASQLAVGALLETIVIAASREARRVSISRRPDTPDDHLLIDVRFEHDPTVSADPLAAVVQSRVVQRRPMSARPLNGAQKRALEAALPEGYRVQWFETPAQRGRVTRLTFDSAKIRLTIPEAYAVHRSVIEWNAQFSEDRIPEGAVGVDRLTARFMRWALASWARVDFLNRWALGDLPPRVQLDLIPGLACAAHFALVASTATSSVDDYLSAGRVVQRFWLTAAHRGLYIQPEMTPVIFVRYQRDGLPFTRVRVSDARVENLARRLSALVGEQNADALFFMGRIGSGPPPVSRSLRRPLEQLLVP